MNLSLTAWFNFISSSVINGAATRVIFSRNLQRISNMQKVREACNTVERQVVKKSAYFYTVETHISGHSRE